MFLESKNIPELQRLLDGTKPDDFKKILGADISLSAALFLLAVTHRALRTAGHGATASHIARSGRH